MPERIRFKATIAFVFVMLVTSQSLLAVFKQGYVVTKKLTSPSHYWLLAHHATKENTISIIDKLILESHGQEVQLCSRTSYSPSLYIYNSIVKHPARDSVIYRAPSNQECNLLKDDQMVKRLLFGSSKPPSDA